LFVFLFTAAGEPAPSWPADTLNRLLKSRMVPRRALVAACIALAVGGRGAAAVAATAAATVDERLLAHEAVATSASASPPSTAPAGPATGAPLFFSIQSGGAVLTLDPATFEGNLTLAGVAGKATWWSERPTRAAGSLATAALASDARLIGETGAWLDTPNAALYGGANLGEGEGAVMVRERGAEHGGTGFFFFFSLSRVRVCPFFFSTHAPSLSSPFFPHIQATVILTITAAPEFHAQTRRLTMPVSLIGVSSKNPWGEETGGGEGGGEGGEGGGGEGSGGGGGEGSGGGGGSGSGTSPGPRGWRDVAAAQAAATAAARAASDGGDTRPAPTQGGPLSLTLSGASLLIDQWLLPTSYSNDGSGYCLSAMDPACQPFVYGGGGTYYMY